MAGTKVAGNLAMVGMRSLTKPGVEPLPPLSILFTYLSRRALSTPSATLVRPHYATRHTVAKCGKATLQKSCHAASICGRCIGSAVASCSMLHVLKIWSANCCRSHQRKPRDIDAAILFSVVLKTADRVALTPTPANRVPTKTEHVAYMIRHKYWSTRAVVAGNNFISTSVLYFVTGYLPFSYY